MTQSYDRMARPLRRKAIPLLVASLILLLPAWIDWFVNGGTIAGAPYPVWFALVLLGNVALTMAGPHWKRRLVLVVQRALINPLVRLSLHCRVPMGWALLRTTGRRTGRVRSVPVGNGRVGDVLWVIAEHGNRAGYVHNIRAEPRVEVLIRTRGLRMEWIAGHATVLDADDPHARQRLFAGWQHPVRLLNAMIVRVLGTDPLTVRVDLEPSDTDTDTDTDTHVLVGADGFEPPTARV
ncbi:nitroreductase/quinone reductase family protein [Nakamurella sp. A5-74]|uniref:Nitroreductase/quinone reductase family protein n=1 Tax=Nakamurella sp. A5-74 TaxID=3158264 RepID=A0AAU8DUM7_9ACTN